MADHWVKSKHVPEEPGFHCSCVAVSGQTPRSRAVVTFCNVSALLDAEILATNIIVQIWGCETGLVSRIEDCAVECGIAASDIGRNIISRRLTKVSGPPESAIRVLMS